ncbi:MAG: hypothetical protein H6721_08460 [Sandaracinus sp.]|nr:hypothetical protein [Sandaracinus sp.]
MPTLAEQITSWREERSQTARGFVQVVWALVRASTEPDEAVDAALGTLARVELARVEALDAGEASFAFETPFGPFTWKVTPDAPSVDRLVILLGAFATHDASVLERAAVWSLRPEVRRPRDAGWFTPTLLDLVLAAATGRDTNALASTTPPHPAALSHHVFVDFVVATSRGALAPSVRALGRSWGLRGARHFRRAHPLSASGRASYVARRDALDADPSALVRRLDAFTFAPHEEVLGAIFAEADALGLPRGRRGRRSARCVPRDLGRAASFVAARHEASVVVARGEARRPTERPRLDGLFAHATPSERTKPKRCSHAPSTPHRARTGRCSRSNVGPSFSRHATNDEAHARATAWLATDQPREARRARARHDDVEALTLRRRASKALGEPTLATSARLASRTHPHDPTRALAWLAELEPETPPATRAAATTPDFVSLAWVHALREAGAVAHAHTLAADLRLDELLGARTADPELVFVALAKACRPSASRHPYAASPVSDLRRVLAMLTNPTPEVLARVATIGADVAEPTLREVLDAWLAVTPEPASALGVTPESASSAVTPEPAPSAETRAPTHDEAPVAPGIVRRKRRR